MGEKTMTSERTVIPENLVLTSGSFLNLLNTLVNTFGSAGESMIYQMGHENGMVFCREVVSNINNEGESLEDVFEKVINSASQIGWANMVVEEFNPQNGKIKVVLQDNSFKQFCLRLNMPQCFFLRGYISGIIKELTNVDYQFSRSECYAHGDEHCSIRLVAEY
jgi:predicted hydrocarbon binding protein